MASTGIITTSGVNDGCSCLCPGYKFDRNAPAGVEVVIIQDSGAPFVVPTASLIGAD